jgi:hypothetical protein
VIMPIPRRLYIEQVLDLYRRAPGTTGHLRRSDRLLAGELHDRRIPLDLVCDALILAVLRRSFRPADAPPLATIGSLHYFKPVIDELLAQPPEPGYLAYIRHRLATVAPHFLAAAHRLP